MASSSLLLPGGSRAPSIRSGTATPVPPPPSVAPGTALPQSNSKALGSRLRHLVENPTRSATFAVNLTIHELSNIPQLNGKFAVKWKFRGTKPSNGDKLLEHPEKRMPMHVRPGPSGMPTLRPSSSMMSLRTPVQAGSGGSTPSLHSANAKQRSLHALAPNVPFSVPSYTSTPTPRSQHPHPQHTLPPSVVSRSATTGNAYPTVNGAHRKEASTGSGTTVATSTSSDRIAIDDPADADSVVIDDGASASAPPSSTQSTYSLNSAITKPGGLPVPPPGRPRSTSSITRSGTAPAIISSDERSSRVTSRASIRSDGSIEPPGSFNSAPASTHAHAPDSTERRGCTPIEQIHAHAVQWEYEIQYIIRIPLGKPVPVADKSKTRQASPSRRSRTLPILGEGALSNSGIKLMIEQTYDGDTHATPFGYVNIDLAPFAELGSTSRKFLLKESKTNATIRISVGMRFIGGQQQWVAPPLREGHFVNDISQLTGEDNLYKELQLLPTASRSSDSATSSSLSGRPSNRSANSEVSLTRQPSNVNVVTQQTKHRYKSYEHHLRPEHDRNSRRNMFGELQPRSSSARRPTVMTSSTATDVSLRTFGTGEGDSMASWPESTYTLPSTILSTKALQMSPVSSPALVPTTMPSSPLAEKSMGGKGYFDQSPTSTRKPVDSPTILSRSLSQDDQPLSPVEGSLMSPELQPLSPEQSPPSLGLPQHGRHHNSHRAYLYGANRHRSDDLQPDLVIEHVFNPRAAEEVGPFTFVPNEEDEDEMYEDVEGLDGLQLDAEPEVPIHHRRWSRIRRRVISSTHRGRSHLETTGGVSSAVY